MNRQQYEQNNTAKMLGKKNKAGELTTKYQEIIAFLILKANLRK